MFSLRYLTRMNVASLADEASVFAWFEVELICKIIYHSWSQLKSFKNVKFVVLSSDSVRLIIFNQNIRLFSNRYGATCYSWIWKYQLSSLLSIKNWTQWKINRKIVGSRSTKFKWIKIFFLAQLSFRVKFSHSLITPPGWVTCEPVIHNDFPFSVVLLLFPAQQTLPVINLSVNSKQSH